ncbi:MAG: prenyltransferase/squalene oxidase repeat-containing protein [Isosphaeraceae bacterium]|nr:prenyltransferase/squalene oxidase repeat-containing protein [Isosphaeraceae bacterium]
MIASRSRARRRLRIAMHRIGRRLEGTSSGLLRNAPSWGISLALHLSALVVMAMIYFVQPVEERAAGFESGIDGSAPLGEDVTSLVPGERAGDPFTTAVGSDFPSLGFPSNDPNLTVTATPRMPASIAFNERIELSTSALAGPSLRLTDIVVGESNRMGVHIEDLSAPFSGRDDLMKARLIRRQGGTVESEKSVTAGLEWLARHQKADGSWSLDCHPQCRGEGCPSEPSMRSDVAATGLALLPMLGAGHSHMKEGRYQEPIRRGLAWLLKQQSRDGELFLGGSGNTRYYTHAIGCMTICEAYGLTKDPKLRVPAQRALAFIAKTQNTADGGWRYYLGQPGDTSVFGWQIFALRSGRLAGLGTPKNVTTGCRRYLDLAATDDRGITYGYLPGSPISMVMTAEALLCRQYLGWPKDHPALREGSRLVASDLRESTERNIYYWYYATQMLHNMQDKDWKDWNTRLREGLISMQTAGEGCDRGSWDPNRPQPDVQGRRVGRHYTTALSILTLEVYYRFLPLYRVVGEDPVGPDAEHAAAESEAAATK